MKLDVKQVKKTLQEQKQVLQSTYHVGELGVFGSVARGESSEASDADVLVSFTQPVGMFTFLKLEAYLSQLLGKKVDLVTKNALKPAIKEEILQEVAYV